MTVSSQSSPKTITFQEALETTSVEANKKPHSARGERTKEETSKVMQRTVSLRKAQIVPSPAKLQADRVKKSKRFSLMLSKPQGINLSHPERITSKELETLLNDESVLLSDQFLQDLKITEIEGLPQEVMIDKFVNDENWSKLTDWQKIILQSKRDLHLANKDLPHYPLLKLKESPASLFNEVSKAALNLLSPKQILIVLNTHGEKLEPERQSLLFRRLPESFYSELEPEMILRLLPKVPESAPALTQAEERLKIRENLLAYLGPLADMAFFDRDEQIKFFSYFLQPSKHSLVLNSTLYLEAASLQNRCFAKELQKFITYKDLVKALLEDKPLIRIINPSDKPQHVVNETELGSKYYDDKALVPLALKKPHFSMALGSLYPILEDKSRSRDPISQDQVYYKWLEGSFVFSSAAERGTYLSTNAAEEANRAFMHSITPNIVFGLMKTHHQVFKALIDGIYAVDLKLKRLSKVSHLALIGQHQAGTTWSLFGVSVGELKVFHYKRESKTALDITARLGSKSTPKAFLGHSDSDFSSLANLALFHLEVEEGDIVIPMSPGIYLQMDPQLLCLKPCEAFEKIHLNSSQVNPGHYDLSLLTPDSEWSENPTHELLKERFIERRLAHLVRKALREKKDIVETLIKYCRRKTHTRRKALTGKDLAPDVTHLTGKLQHYSISAFILPPLIGKPPVPV